MAYLNEMVLRGAAPQRGGQKARRPAGGPERPRLLCCRISQTHYPESARSSAAHTGHFRPIAIPAITRTGSQVSKLDRWRKWLILAGLVEGGQDVQDVSGLSIQELGVRSV